MEKMKCNFKKSYLKISIAILVTLSLFILLFMPIAPIYADTVSDEGTANEYKGIGLKIAERALESVGQGYSLTDRYGPTYYDCSGLIYATLRDVGQELYGKTDMTGVPTYTGAWTTLINSKSVGDTMTFNGIEYKLTAKNITIYSSEYFEKPGTIMIFDGHAAFSLGTYDYQGTWYDTVDYVAEYLIEKYGNTVTDLKTELVRDAKAGFYGADCIVINANWQTNYNKVWKVDALNTTLGVAVNNTHYGKSSTSTTVLGVWEPVEPLQSGTVKVNKVDEISGIGLSGATFTLYEWSAASGNYAKVGTLDDNKDGTYTLSKYTSRATGTTIATQKLLYTQDNLGKFKLEETKNPTNYTGSWSKEFVLDTDGENFIYSVTNAPKLVTLTLVKRIKASDIVWGNGNPTFILKVSGTDIQGNSHTYYKPVEFTKSYVAAHTDSSGYTSMSVTFSNMIVGTYTGSEESTARYKFQGISSVVNGTVSGETVKFDLVNNSNGSATFTNVKYEWGGTSHTSCVINEIK